MKALLASMKSLYLFMVAKRSNQQTQKNDKIIFLLSFPLTSHWMLTGLYEKFGKRLVICYTKNAQELAQSYQNLGCDIYRLDSFSELLWKAIPIIKGSTMILCDNYFPFLGGVTFDEDTKVVQLWHAGGAIKTFGLQAEYAKNSSIQDRQRFQRVYDRQTHYVVGSNRMSEIFKASYQAKNAEFLPFGYIPTDRYFDEAWLVQAKKQFRHLFGTKKSLLYVPTYRENDSANPIDFSKLAAALGDEWQVFAKAHPHDQTLQQKLAADPQVITDFKKMSLQEILPSIDCLISDYSSVPFEYTLANPQGKLLFFCYDLQSYQTEVGIQTAFFEQFPEAVAETLDELIKKTAAAQSIDFQVFNRTWNQYNHGTAMKQLTNWMEENGA
ncbi:CDP-glycerol glycerophosphotransferase family protein [Enterococcus massiliensis]|uniref:CDP-glycerol glycerophosphotransferase family protein n=1 Tax=Enterococcus massiliensis TaxID=1640685 RepID=UPI00065E6607|nr:CDP-glycerol glycerophosphotransferase family protein [Enterococcus massiliensis]